MITKTSFDEFHQEAHAIVQVYKNDPEAMHSRLDELMEETLITLGYGKSIEFIRQQTRWYAQ